MTQKRVSDSSGLRATYTVLIGNVGVGKDTVENLLKKRHNLERAILNEGSKGEWVHFLEEAVNHDQVVLDEFYADMEANTEAFEIATLAPRAILARRIKRLRGIAVGNRYIIEARSTFVEVNSRKREDGEEPYMRPGGVANYDSILAREIEKGLPMPDLAILLKVGDPRILAQRIKDRGIAAEKKLSEDIEYISALNRRYEYLETHFEDIHRQRNLTPPRLVVLDVSQDMKANPKFLNRIVRRCEEAIIETYRTRKEQQAKLYKR